MIKEQTARYILSSKQEAKHNNSTTLSVLCFVAFRFLFFSFFLVSTASPNPIQTNPICFTSSRKSRNRYYSEDFFLDVRVDDDFMELRSLFSMKGNQKLPPWRACLPRPPNPLSDDRCRRIGLWSLVICYPLLLPGMSVCEWCISKALFGFECIGIIVFCVFVFTSGLDRIGSEMKFHCVFVCVFPGLFMMSVVRAARTIQLDCLGLRECITSCCCVLRCCARRSAKIAPLSVPSSSSSSAAAVAGGQLKLTELPSVDRDGKVACIVLDWIGLVVVSAFSVLLCWLFPLWFVSLAVVVSALSLIRFTQLVCVLLNFSCVFCFAAKYLCFVSRPFSWRHDDNGRCCCRCLLFLSMRLSCFLQTQLTRWRDR